LNLKKIVGAGLVAGVIIFLIMIMMNFAFEAMIPDYGEWLAGQPGMRAWDDPMMLLFFLHPFVYGLAMAGVYSQLGDCVKARGFVKKGLVFGFLVWIVATVPGQFLVLTSMNYPLAIVASWAFAPLIELPLAGIGLAWFFEKRILEE